MKSERSELVRYYPEKFKGYITKHVPKFNVIHPEYDPTKKDKLIAEFFAAQEERSKRDGSHKYSIIKSMHSLMAAHHNRSSITFGHISCRAGGPDCSQDPGLRSCVFLHSNILVILGAFVLR